MKCSLVFSSILITVALCSAQPVCCENAPKASALPDPTNEAALLEAGFKPLFNGKDLAGWKKVGGNASYEVKNGAIRGFGTKINRNTFLRTEKDYSDFIFVFQMKMLDRKGNSGCQFRSNHREGNGRVYGYQCEHDNFKKGKRAWTAGVYDEARRGWLYPGKLGGNDEVTKQAFTEQGVKLFDWDGWNTIVIRCQGRHIQTWLNGEKRADFIDKDEENFSPEGFFGLQVHSGESGDILWRNIYIKEL
ncbi:hypothetical protein DDZ13_07770 [Coraliomargarita sinensis]|uniref:3-keto-alpha-glucoside-1,2-lyase/3-keto-2-hydroxy-glucal hydratase domain-containing protein n=1 Tax=Coraliomargarita sinensis TaxID=2174842 RepID=A0A317ZG69_9BACT|nr:DUF1080 domain-containing protein [Coraliomargarita sinensis]PXA04420.1 hypothetical protein DDZ13_07770 [Coraliomargarita sinensis]